MYRRNRNHDSLDTSERDGEPSAMRLPDPARSPEEHAIARDEAHQLRAMLATLPDRQRHIIELRLADLTGAEIAETLGMTVSAVKSAQFRAYATLRDRFPDLHTGRSS